MQSCGQGEEKNRKVKQKGRDKIENPILPPFRFLLLFQTVLAIVRIRLSFHFSGSFESSKGKKRFQMGNNRRLSAQQSATIMAACIQNTRDT